jgi:murein L,D-transpeptidase YafK
MSGYTTPASGTSSGTETRRRRWAPLLFLGAGLPLALALAWVGSLALPRATPTPSCSQPEIRIYKSEGVLELVCAGTVARSMPATFGPNPIGPKQREGDGRTPEGTYRVSSKLKNHFHRFLGVSYPNEKDLERARALGINNPGGAIGIHGVDDEKAALSRLWIRFAQATDLARFWGPTAGCIALTNEDVEALFEVVPVGTKVVIAASR